MTKVVIIGGGIAGLSTGCFLQMNGYDTEIFELHKAGGLCASWKRKGYTIDGCIHWWVGINPNDECYSTLEALFDIENLPKVIYDEFYSMEVDGKVLSFIGDLDQFEKELKAHCPQDSKSIENLISMARTMALFSMPGNKAPELMNLEEKIQISKKMQSILSIFDTWKLSLDEFIKQFQSPLIKKFFSLLAWWEAPVLGIIMNASWFHNKNTCYPIGGAKKLVSILIERYKTLGGKIYENSKVNKIMIKDGLAKGIQLENGQIYQSDYTISAADGYDTVVNMLGKENIDKNTKELYFTKKYVPKKSQIYVSLGIARTFNNSFKPYVYIFLKKILKIGQTEITNVGITIYNFDPTSAPAGKTLLTMMLPIYDTEYWVNLRDENKSEYEKKKKEIARHLIEEIEEHFGDIKEKVEMIDVATPATFIRYTNNWNGAPMAWQDFNLTINKPKKEIEGLKNFYMCGQWVGDLGISGAAKSGRDVAQILCKCEGKQFKIIRKDIEVVCS